jgi:hypothetical protein
MREIKRLSVWKKRGVQGSLYVVDSVDKKEVILSVLGRNDESIAATTEELNADYEFVFQHAESFDGAARQKTSVKSVVTAAIGAYLALFVAATPAYSAPQKQTAPAKSEEKFDLRKERAKLLLEKGTNFAALESVAKKNADFRKGEEYYQTTLTTTDRKYFAEQTTLAAESYLKAAKSGVVLAALYAKHLADDRYYNVNHIYIDWTKRAGEALIKAGHCTGYLTQSNSYLRAKDWASLERVSNEGVAKCDPKLVEDWMIVFLRVNAAKGKGAQETIAKREAAKRAEQ